jgi:hypothetical protein
LSIWLETILQDAVLQFLAKRTQFSAMKSTADIGLPIDEPLVSRQLGDCLSWR